MTIDLANWIKVITDAGLVGVLALAIYAFIKGWIVPAAVMERRCADMQELARRQMAEDFTEKVKDAVKAGFMAAWYELRESGGAKTKTPHL